MVLFNRNRPIVGNSIEEPSQDLIEASFNLRQASLEDAIRFGGPLTRAALEQIRFSDHPRKHIIVDTKVNYLMRGMYPAIPGWHTDGVPRGEYLNPGGKGEPNLTAQDEGQITAPTYHLLVTGTISQTEFLVHNVDFDLPNSRDLYKIMTEKVTKYIDELSVHFPVPIMVAPSNTWVTWDWWNIHRAVPSNSTGWRYLIRVTETDHIEPRTKDFIRMQSQVYVPVEYGW